MNGPREDLNTVSIILYNYTLCNNTVDINIYKCNLYSKYKFSV